jgi:hypothetical protein
MNINSDNFGAGSEGGAESNDPNWLEARRREEAMRKLLNRSKGKRLKMAEVQGVAFDLGVSQAALYRLTTAHRRAPTVGAPEPKRRARP